MGGATSGVMASGTGVASTAGDVGVGLQFRRAPVSDAASPVIAPSLFPPSTSTSGTILMWPSATAPAMATAAVAAARWPRPARRSRRPWPDRVPRSPWPGRGRSRGACPPLPDRSVARRWPHLPPARHGPRPPPSGCRRSRWPWPGPSACPRFPGRARGRPAPPARAAAPRT